MVVYRRLIALCSLIILLCACNFNALQAQDATPSIPGAAQMGAVVVGDRVIFTLRAGVGSISPLERAGIVNARLNRVLSDPKLLPESLEVQAPKQAGDDPLLVVSGLPLISVIEADVSAESATQPASITQLELAERWARLLREALIQAKPLYHGDEQEGISFLPLLIVSALAFAVPLLTSRFKKFPIPIVVGEILVGILIGRSGFGLVHYDSWLQFLAEFGFAYLMFLSGLEVDVDLLARKNGTEQAELTQRQNPLLIAFTVFGLTLLLAFGVALALTAFRLIKQPWLMALVLSTTSLGLVVPILKERGGTTASFGQAILLCALVADFITMFLITVVAGWLSSGPTLKLFLGLGLLIVFAIAVRVGLVLKRSAKLDGLFAGLSHATAQISVRGSLFLMLAFVALSAQLGTEVILGAFLAGVLLALFTERKTGDLHHKLEALGFGFFIPIFFVMVGVRFDLSALTGSPQGMLLAPLLIVGAFAIKLLASLPLRRLASWRETLAGGFLLSSRLSLIIAAAEIGQRLGLFPETVYAALIAVALVTAITGPMGFQLLLPHKEKTA